MRDLTEHVGLDAVRGAIEARRTGVEDGDPGDLRTPEWRVFCSPADAPESDDFKLRAVGPPRGRAGELADVVLVERLREVSALTGFTRISAPDLAAAGGAVAPQPRPPPHLHDGDAPAPHDIRRTHSRCGQ